MMISRDGALTELSQVVKQSSASRVLLVLDERAAAGTGSSQLIKTAMANCSVQRFVDFNPNPKLEDVERGLRQIDGQVPNLIVAFGGGTAIDIGKLLACFCQQTEAAEDIITGRCQIRQPAIPILAIPTTAGTGSEATHFAVVYMNGKKFSVAHPSLLPQHVILDPLLTTKLPRSVTASTGLDAFCQAVESLWAVGATIESMSDAEEAIRLAAEHLACVVNQPTLESRRAICRASHLAGRAINVSKTTASHALSYAMTSNHGIPHGQAVAMTLAPLLAFNSEVSDDDCQDHRGPEHVRQRTKQIAELLGCQSVAEACGWIQSLLREIDCPISLAEAGISDNESLQAILCSVNLERLSNNPRRADRAALRKMIAGDFL